MTAPAVLERPRYANYWEDDQTANPKIVRIIEQDGDNFTVALPNAEGQRQVHLHHLGTPHYAL